MGIPELPLPPISASSISNSGLEGSVVTTVVVVEPRLCSIKANSSSKRFILNSLRTRLTYPTAQVIIIVPIQGVVNCPTVVWALAAERGDREEVTSDVMFSVVEWV